MENGGTGICIEAASNIYEHKVTIYYPEPNTDNYNFGNIPSRNIWRLG